MKLEEIDSELLKYLIAVKGYRAETIKHNNKEWLQHHELEYKIEQHISSRECARIIRDKVSDDIKESLEEAKKFTSKKINEVNIVVGCLALLYLALSIFVLLRAYTN